MDHPKISDLATCASKSIIEDYSCCNFYDWFCADSALKRKAPGLLSKAKKLVEANKKSGLLKINGECEVFFKNNCPCYGDGKLYDSFSITSNDDGVICWVAPRNPYGKAEIAFEGHGLREGDAGSLQFESYKDLLRAISDHKPMSR